MIELLTLARDALCVRDQDIGKLKGGKKWQVYSDTLGNLGASRIVEIYVEDEDRRFLADATTGSLYDPETLRCFTGALELRKK